MDSALHPERPPLFGSGIFVIALCWSLFQLYVASPLVYIFNLIEINEDQQRPIHLAFALVLAFVTSIRSDQSSVTKSGNLLLALVSAISCLYLFVFYQEVISNAGGQHSIAELAVSVAGISCLLEAARRGSGLGLTAVAVAFIAYALGGKYFPDAISHGGVSINKLADHLWLTSEGVFGITLAVSNDLIYLFVLFGALLERAGAGRYFIRLALALVGHLKGGPAKACVISSALFGTISGSSLANLMTVGTFTIPLMKKVGFSAEKAAAIETCSSINGQLMPPVMGAAAFIMAEYLNIPYSDVIKHAFLPASIAYITLYYIVHIEAEKLGIPVLRKNVALSGRRLISSLAGLLLGFTVLAAIAGIARALEELPGLFPAYFTALSLGALYLYLLRFGIRYSNEQEEELDITKMATLPPVLPTLLSGLYHFIPVGILIWCLMVSRLSAKSAVMWGIVATVAIVISRPLALRMFAHPKPDNGLGSAAIVGVRDLVQALVTGGLNMVGIALALGAAGIVVGVVSQTGIGLSITGLIETIAGTNFTLTLFLTAVITLILGMGLPTTANYIVVVALMVTPITVLAQQSGLIVPPIAIHLFVFYFGLLAGTTPPVAVDAFAGAAVAQADPIKTSIQAFLYDLRTSTLPFIFVFNNELLMIGISNVFQFVVVVLTAIIGMIAFAGVIQKYFVFHNRIWEAAVLLVASFMLLRPGFFVDLAYPPFKDVNAQEFEQIVQSDPAGKQVRFTFEGTNVSGDRRQQMLLVELGGVGAQAAERLRGATGLLLRREGNGFRIERVEPNSPAQRIGIRPSSHIINIEAHTDQPNKHWIFLPALAAIGLVGLLQLRRRTRIRGVQMA
jgi:TRAP transporter 4TM/12TM fusion protein